MSTTATTQAIEFYEEQLLAIQRAELEFAKQHRIYFYRPRGEQVPFHASKAHVRLAQGTNKSGKTTVGAIESIAFCLGFRPWELPAKLKDFPIDYLLAHPELIPDACKTPIHRPTKGIIIEDDWDKVDEILTVGTDSRPGKLTQYIPPAALSSRPVKNSLGHLCQYHIRSIYGGNSLLVLDTEKSYVNNPGSFEGGDYDFVQYDEPKCRGLRTALKRGLAVTFGYEWFTFTALTEPWMKDSLYDKAGIDPEIAAFHFDAEDLIKEGIISREGWDAFASSLDESEKEARILGRWSHLSGLVYPQFIARAVADGGHLCDPLDDEWIAEHASLFLAVDPHPRNPMAAMILAADDRGRWIVWRELYEKELIEEFCAHLDVLLGWKDKQGEQQRHFLLTQIMDPIAWIEDPVDGSTWADEFSLYGYTFDKATKDKSRGILNVRKAFKDNQLVICRNCTRTIWELQNYVFGNWAPSASQGKDPKERPVDKDDHMMENLYRLVNLRPYHIPIKERNLELQVRDLCPAI